MNEIAVTPMAAGPTRRFSPRAILLALALLPAVGLAAAGAVSWHNTITPEGIIVHHSALTTFQAGRPADVRLLDRVHRRRGYGIFYWGRFYHVGYHYVILPDGTVQAGRPVECKGAHARGFNTYIGICLIGDFSTSHNQAGERGLQEPTAAQMAALATLCRQLSGRYQIPPRRIQRHSDVNPDTQCPGDRFHLGGLLDRLSETH
jgi:hypothetical protein